MKTTETKASEPTTPASNVALIGTVSILLVDDDPRNLDVLESILASPEFKLVRAQSPDDALMRLVQEDIACIVLDIQMPSMTGIELARLIKTRKRSQHIPIIFLTAYFQAEKDILKGYGAGAVDYLTKPLMPEILKSKVGVFVDLFRKTRALTQANNNLELEINQRKKAEEALRQANEQLALRVEERTSDLIRAVTELHLTEIRYREVVHGLAAAVYVCDAEGRITLFNQASVELWGREPVLGKDLWCGSHQIFRLDGTAMPLDEYPMALTVRHGHPVRGSEIIIESPDGSRRNVLPFPEPIRDASGKIIGAVNMLMDITERKRAEKASRQLAAIVESSNDAIISIDLNAIITGWNDGARRIFGYTAGEIIGESVEILVRPSKEPHVLERVRKGERVHHFETTRQRKGGIVVAISMTVSPIKDDGGKIIGVSKIIRDITEQKKAEQELERAHQQALAAGRAKDEFLATLSHELRTPLNPVLLIATDAAENPELPPSARADFEKIRRNVELEARLIDDLLDLTRISHNKLVLETRFLDIHDVLRQAIATVQDEINQKRIILTLDLAAPEHMVVGDEVRLQQVFWNVLKNAAKFTPEGGTIKVATHASDTGNQLAVEIVDNGIGMSMEDIGRIFEAFSQGNHDRPPGSHHFGGLGLGLAISRKLAELHSGSIRAVSAGSNQGATFIIELPLAQSEMMNKNSAKTSLGSRGRKISENSHRILLVEDHEPTRSALTQLLTRRNYRVTSAETLAEARKLVETNEFDLLMSDIGLPDGTGYELMAEIRKLKKPIPGIALTGFGMEQDIVRSQSVGFVRHLTKPIRMQSLDSALAEIFTKFDSTSA